MAITLIANYKHSTPGIVQAPDPVLRTKSKPVAKIDASAKQVAKELLGILKRVDRRSSPWLGMAAPQLGYSTRIIAVKEHFHSYIVMINPKVQEQRFWLPAISACLSLKGLYLTKRPYWLKVAYRDLQGFEQTRAFYGGKATVLQQEIDHINGKLICD